MSPLIRQIELIFWSLEVVDRGSETHLQVNKILNL